MKTGKRKSSIATVMLKKGKGKIIINDRKIEDYICSKNLILKTIEPLIHTKTKDKYDFIIKVKGGGISGQAIAIRHGIAKSLLAENSEHRKILKKYKFLTRDSRIKERKKPGLKKARKSPQFSKR